MVTIEIYWKDLTEEKRKEIQETLGMGDSDDWNWDTFPLATLDIEEEDAE